MSKKLSRHLEDIERTEKKMAELQAHLEAVRQTQKADEDAEIVRSIRSMNVTGWELLKLLEDIQSGAVELRAVESADAASESSDRNAETTTNEPRQVPDSAPESEDEHDEEN